MISPAERLLKCPGKFLMFVYGFIIIDFDSTKNLSSSHGQCMTPFFSVPTPCALYMVPPLGFYRNSARMSQLAVEGFILSLDKA
jgi:hypothetical protein